MDFGYVHVGRQGSLTAPGWMSSQRCARNALGRELKSGSPGQVGYASSGSPSPGARSGGGVWVGAVDRGVGRGERAAWPLRVQLGLSLFSDSWAPSDPPYLVLRRFSFFVWFS